MSQSTREPLSWFREPTQLRKDLGSQLDLRNLGESIRKQQLAPVGALTTGELIYGFRRYRAACLVGLPDLAVIKYDQRLTATEIMSIQFTENIHRLDMSAYEKWNACEELRKLNPSWSAKDLAEYLKLDPSAVTKLLSPSKCIPEWQHALKAGDVGISDCYQVSLAPREQQLELLDLKRAGANRDAICRAVQRTNPKREAHSVRSSRITIPLESGARIVVSGKSLSLPEVVETLAACLEAAKRGLRERLDARTWQCVMRDKSLTSEATNDA